MLIELQMQFVIFLVEIIMNNKDFLKYIKENTSNRGPNLIIPVGNPIECFLRPVSTAVTKLNLEDVTVLTQWRNQFASSFLTKFEATEDRTIDWLVNVVQHNDNKILFMIEDIKSVTFGYMGLDFINWADLSCELDAIVRGRHSRPGLMSVSLLTLISWAKVFLGLKHFSVRVLSNNTALDFYRKLGFVEKSRVSLREIIQADKVCLVEDEKLEVSPVCLVKMVYLSQNSIGRLNENFC